MQKQTVYVVVQTIPYEGDAIIGIYANEADADKVAEHQNNTSDGHHSVDYWDVE